MYYHNKDIFPMSNYRLGEEKSMHYSNGDKEWGDGVFSYNANYAKTLPMSHSIAYMMIKSYFSLDTLKKGNKKSKKNRNNTKEIIA